MKQHLTKLGWVITAVMAATMIGTGFQAKMEKIGVVDISKILAESDMAKKQDEDMRALFNRRKDALDFATTYSVFTDAQAERFKVLSVKDTLTGPEKSELEKIKSDVQAADKTYKDLIVKTNPTAADVQKLKDYGDLSQKMAGKVQAWTNEFDEDLKNRQLKQQQDSFQLVKDAVSKIGKDQGYTVIFTKDAATYGSNDITDAVMKAVSKK